MTGLMRHSSHPLVKTGDLYFNDSNYIEAIKIYDKAISVNENNKDALMGKALALRELGRYDDAISCLNEYIKLDKEDLDGLIVKGDTYICKNEYIEANECFDECLKIDKKDPIALTGKGIVSYLNGAHHPAIQYWDKALGGRKNVDLAHIWANKGNAWFDLQRYDEALECYSRAIVLNRNETSALIGKANFFKISGREEEVDKIHNIVLDIDPDYMALIWMNDGIEYHSEGKFIEAINLYDKIIDISLKRKISQQYVSLVHINKGLSLYSISKFVDAINCFDEALKLDSPFSPLALIGKGASMDKLLNPDSAIECYKKALDLDSTLEIISTTCIIYYHNNETYSFIPIFDNDSANSLALRCKMSLNQFIGSPKLDPDIEDIALNGYQGGANFSQRYPNKKLSQDELQQIKIAASEIGIAGEEYINFYLDRLLKKGEIKSFQWVSKENAISQYDFCILNGGQKTLIDVKSTQGCFDNLIHISYGELKRMAFGQEKYDIYRVYGLNDGIAKLKISESLKSFASDIFEIFKGLPDGIIPEGISVPTSLLIFGPEIEIKK